MIKDRTDTPFTLAIDTPASATKEYSPGKREFDNYVVDANGKIAAVIDGSLKTRAKAEQLIQVLTELKADNSDENASEGGDEKAAVERAVLDYVEGVYEVKPEWIRRSVHPELTKFGFWRPEDAKEHRDGGAMTFDQLVALAGSYNKDGHVPSEAPKEIEVFDVMEKMAAAKLNAYWGTDYFHLVKEDGKWMIRHVVWQSPSAK